MEVDPAVRAGLPTLDLFGQTIDVHGDPQIDIGEISVHDRLGSGIQISPLCEIKLATCSVEKRIQLRIEVAGSITLSGRTMDWVK
jgi:hypothetical protein